VRPVKPNRESLFDELHVGRNVPHHRQLPLAPLLGVLTVFGQHTLDRFEVLGLPGADPGMEQRISPEQFGVGHWSRGRHPNGNVEMVAHRRGRDHLDPAVVGHQPNVLAEHFPFDVAEEKFTVRLIR